MTITNSLAVIAVQDLDAAAAWYEKLFDRPADARPMPKLAEWRCGKGGWLQVLADPRRAGSSSVTLVVDDMEGQLLALGAKAIVVDRSTSSNAAKTALIHDPDGNKIVFAQGFDQFHLSTSS